MPERETDALHMGAAADERFSSAAMRHAPREAGGDGRRAPAVAGEAAARAWRERSARDLGIPITAAASGAHLALGAPCLDPRAGSERLVDSDPTVADAPRHPGHIGFTGRISRSFGAAPAPAPRGRP